MIHKLEIREKEGAFFGLSYLQNKITTEITRIRNIYKQSNGFLFDRIHISTALFNILSDSKQFHIIADEDDAVGVIGGMHVYIDFSIPRNKIRLALGKTQTRDLKINAILDKDESEKIFDVIIEVDSDLI